MLRATHSFQNKFFGLRVSRTAASEVVTGFTPARRLRFLHGFNGFNVNQRPKLENFPHAFCRGVDGDQVLAHGLGQPPKLSLLSTSRKITKKFLGVASQLREHEQNCTDAAEVICLVSGIAIDYRRLYRIHFGTGWSSQRFEPGEAHVKGLNGYAN